VDLPLRNAPNRFPDPGAFPVTASMLRNEKGRDLVATVPIDRLLTETDAPFTQVNNRPTSPTDVKETVDTLATFRSMTTADLTQAITLNLRTLLTAVEALQ
jgi:TatD DNase family protein